MPPIFGADTTVKKPRETQEPRAEHEPKVGVTVADNEAGKTSPSDSDREDLIEALRSSHLNPKQACRGEGIIREESGHGKGIERKRRASADGREGGEILRSSKMTKQEQERRHNIYGPDQLGETSRMGALRHGGSGVIHVPSGTVVEEPKDGTADEPPQRP